MKRLTALLAATLLVLAGCGSGADEADVTFAQQMLPHHEQAVEMSAMVGPDSSPEVQDLAARIAAEQEPEIETMQGWLREWDADESASMDSMGSMEGMMSDDQMAQLDAASGETFDRTWLEMMIEHHRGAITMAEAVLEEGDDPEVAQLAEEIIDAQRAEITEMEGLLS